MTPDGKAPNNLKIPDENYFTSLAHGEIEMTALLKIRDEFFGAKTPTSPSSINLKIASARISAREIIRQRVFVEVAEINEQRMSHERTRSFLIGVEEGSAEDALNRHSPRERRASHLLDAEEEFAKAVTGFQTNRFIMLLDDRQVQNLDEDLTVVPDSEVTFLHLTPLKGG